MDAQRFLESLTATSPKAPRALQLELDVEDPAGMFEFLLTLCIGILKRRYSPPIDLGRITEEHMQECVAYFASFGIQMLVSVEDVPALLHINNKEYETKDTLQEMRFRMSSGSQLYTLQFDFL